MNSIESQFVPYEIAVKLKELGFDWECFRLYDEFEEFSSWATWAKNSKEDKYNVAAPLWQQAFDWFRVVHGFESFISPELHSLENKHIYSYTVCSFDISLDDFLQINNLNEYDTYESARLACLEKLIELVTEKKQGA